MFSLRFPEARHQRETNRNLGRGLLGRVLGFAAGSIIVIAFDAYVLNHAVQEKIFRNNWGMTRAIERVSAFAR